MALLQPRPRRLPNSRRRNPNSRSRTRLKSMKHSQSAPALMGGDDSEYSNYTPVPREVVPGMDAKGFINNRAYPLDPISGEPMITVKEHTDYMTTKKMEEKMGTKSSWMYTGVQMRGYGNCYPGESNANSITHTYHGNQRPPSKIIPLRRNFDIVSGRHLHQWEEGQKLDFFSKDTYKAGTILPSMGDVGLVRPPVRDVSILSWKGPDSARFGQTMSLRDGPNPAVHLKHIPKNSYGLTGKVGEAGFALEKPPQGMYAVCKKVGGDRADNFVRRNAEKREKMRDTTTKPHVSYG